MNDYYLQSYVQQQRLNDLRQRAEIYRHLKQERRSWRLRLATVLYKLARKVEPRASKQSVTISR